VRILLDTHAVLWSAENDARLGREVAAFLRGCEPGDAVISDLTLLEIAMLVKKGRVSLAVPLRDYLRGLQSNYPVLAIQADIAVGAMDLNLPGADPFDRVIVATALHHDLPLATRDRVIADAKLLRTVW
jgi:PIN domain nuclease of toxin-antitoxin system